MFPSLGFDAELAYFSDDGLVYKVATSQSLLLQGVWEPAPPANPQLPFYVTPRHYIAVFSDGIDRVAIRLLVPVPFGQLSVAVPDVVFSQSGLALTVIARIGEASEPFDHID